MCGIAGILISKTSISNINFSKILDEMGNYIKNRGPDSNGKWISNNDNFAMLHTRLSIIGIGSQGAQPMISQNGRYVISFNGEIYNFKTLKQELNNNYEIKWKGNSDTEVLIEGISLLGFEKFIAKTEGMFSLALWDKKDKTLKLARDRLGEKPLYFGRFYSGIFSSFAFSSDIGSLTNLSSKKLKLNKFAITEFINNGWINGEKTIYEDITKVEPGEYIEINITRNSCDFDIKKYKYWQPIFTNSEKPLFSNFQKSKSELKSILLNVLNDQLYSEREMGIFFSGGIDSSLIAALVKKELGINLNCFTCGFSNDLDANSYDETEFASKICNDLNLPHIVRRINTSDVVETLPKMARIFSEPFADISQLGAYIISQKAREEGIVVALGGDGGDELFGGYERYISGSNLLKLNKILPNYIFNSINKIISYFPEEISFKFGKIVGIDKFKDKIEKFSNNANYFYDKETLYLSCISKWDKSNFSLMGLDDYISFKEQFKNEKFKEIKSFDTREYMMLMDLTNYLVNDILVKTDRTSMSVGLEVRSPFLNHKIVNYANSIPANLKFSFGRGKLHLRSILSEYINKKLIDRPKKGFGIPIDKIIRTHAKDWSKNMIDFLKENEEIKLNNKLIDELWLQHLSEKKNNGSCLWNLIMLSSWIKIWR